LSDLTNVRVRPFSDYWPLVQKVLDDPALLNGIALWPGTGGFWGARPGEVTAIAGYNYSGKSTLVMQAILRLVSVKDLSKAIIYSPEMPAVPLTMQVVRQAMARGLTSDDAIKDALEWLSYRIRHVDSEGMSSTILIDLIEEQVHKQNIRWVVVDSLMTLTDIQGDDYPAQKEFMRALMALTRRLELHIFVVAHCRKPSGAVNGRRLNRYDMRGAGEISDFADNVLIVERHKDKNTGKHYQTLLRDKERFSPGREVDELHLEFDQRCQQFYPQGGTGGQPYVAESAA